jgi:hypothetical protein
MFGTTNYPFNFSNRRGIPMLETTSVTVTDTNVVLNLPNRSFRWLNDKGVILLRLNQPIPEGTTGTLPVLFSSNEFTQPLTNIGGAAITAAQITGTGVYIIYYDKDANLMQLMTTAIPAA